VADAVIKAGDSSGPRCGYVESAGLSSLWREAHHALWCPRPRPGRQHLYL